MSQIARFDFWDANEAAAYWIGKCSVADCLYQNSALGFYGDKLLMEYQRVYAQSVYRARSATLYWMWMRASHKDIMLVIGRLIYASRKQPLTWGVKFHKLG